MSESSPTPANLENFDLPYVACVIKHEIAHPSQIYKLSHAQLDNSGFSIGRLQTDFGSHPDKVAIFCKALRETGDFSDENLRRISTALKLRGTHAIHALGEDMGDPLWEAINLALESHTSLQHMVDEFDNQQAEHLVHAVTQAKNAAKRNPRWPNDSAFQTFVNSELFAAIVADMHNQFGTNVFQKFLCGVPAITPGGKFLDHLQPDEELNAARIRQYRENFKSPFLDRFDRVVSEFNEA